ncbi:MAG: hypothetical protein ACLTC4_13820 [Hungatella hathewayi]
MIKEYGGYTYERNLLLLIPVLLPIVAGVLVLTVKRIRGEQLMLGISLAHCWRFCRLHRHRFPAGWRT